MSEEGKYLKRSICLISFNLAKQKRGTILLYKYGVYDKGASRVASQTSSLKLLIPVTYGQTARKSVYAISSI